MATLAQTLLINAITVIPFAALIWLIGRWASRPALTHVLWVLLLVKLVTPPLITLPYLIDIGLPSSVESSDSSRPNTTIRSERNSVRDRTDNVSDLSGTLVQSDATFQEHSSSDAEADKTVIKQDAMVGSAVVPIEPALSSSIAGVTGEWDASTAQIWLATRWFSMLLVGLWMAGSIGMSVIQLRRGLRFARLVRLTRERHGDLDRLVRTTATQLGFRSCPNAMLIHAPISPMVYGYGLGVVLLFPAELFWRLGAEGRSTLVAHELAHFGRRDHWVRLLELVVTTLFWWHPIVWFAKRQIEEAEEECCDAWVVTGMPHSPRRYAEALLDAIDYLCEAPQALPPIASGMGEAPLVRRRLTKIMRGVSPRQLTMSTRWIVGACSVVILLMSPFAFGSSGREIQSTFTKTPSAETIVAMSSNNDDAMVEGDANRSDDVSLPNVTPPTKREPDIQLPKPKNASRGGRGERVWGAAVSSDGRYLLQATTARRVILTNLNSNQQRELPGSEITSVAFLPGTDRFVAGAADGVVSLWNASKFEQESEVYRHDNAIRTIAASPTGDLLAIGGRDGAVRIVDLSSGNIHWENSSNRPVNCVRFSPDGARLAIASGDWIESSMGMVSVWDVSNRTLLREIPSVSAPGAVTFVSNDELIVGLWSGETNLWNLANLQLVGSAIADKQTISSASFSPDNPLLREATFMVDRGTALPDDGVPPIDSPFDRS